MNDKNTTISGKPTKKSGITIKASYNGEHIWLHNENTGETRELVQYIDKGDRANGYCNYKVVSVFGSRLKVHRIVASIFCLGEEEGKIVHHKDGNTFNNCADNLVWLTRSEHKKVHKGNRSMANSLKWNWELHPKLRVYQEIEAVMPDGEVLEFDSQSKAAKWLGMEPSSLSWRLKRGNGQTEKNGIVLRRTENRKKAKAVVATDKDGNETVYKSQNAAAKALGISQGNITRCLNYDKDHAYYLPSVGGYKFRYATGKEVA